MLHDMLFKVEKKQLLLIRLLKKRLIKAQHYADMIMKIAEEMDLEEEHSYIEDVHMAKMKELADKDTEEEDDDMLPPSAKMVQMDDC